METGWMDLNHIKRLKKLVLAPDFNVQSDALETMRVSYFKLIVIIGIIYFKRQV